MNEHGFTKKDWTLFKNKIVDWQESYMGRLNKEYITILNSNANPSEKFWTLEKRLREDKKKSGVCIEMSQSKMIYNILDLINEGAIMVDDLNEFSEELQESIKRIVGLRG